ncbi:MAG: cation diffusion facilitator family transporter, partial [Chloroflexia bacterium]|nr:cation diffusion facilitator family transporter [Chloroflexia bacterium]
MDQPHGHEEHDHNHPHHGGHDQEHQHEHGRLGWLRELLPWGHGHSHGEQNVDSALETSERGIWALKVSLVGLGATALFQVVIVLISGSVALLADTVHNFSDALTAVPLWIAFALARRPPSRRYTYGYGRAEDIAGVIIVGMIALSAAIAAYESVRRFIEPTP